jgi:PqqD family protein of HPr-rel-A system
MNAVARWRPAAPRAIVWRRWDDEIVVYNEATGNTHHLGPLGSDVLLMLLRHPAGIDMAALVREIAERVEFESGAQPADEVRRALLELADAQLAACSSD